MFYSQIPKIWIFPTRCIWNRGCIYLGYSLIPKSGFSLLGVYSGDLCEAILGDLRGVSVRFPRLNVLGIDNLFCPSLVGDINDINDGCVFFW